MTSLLSDSDDESLNEIRVNRKFAKKFEDDAKKKELERAKYLDIGNDEDDDEFDSDDDDNDDDEDDQLDTKLDLQVVKIINKIRKKDPSIYEKSSVWFDSNGFEQSKNDINEKELKSTKKKFKDVIRDQILEDVALDEVDPNEINNKTKIAKQNNKSKLSYDQEQTMLREQILKSVHNNNTDDDNNNNDSDDDDDDDDLLKIKPKNPKEIEKDELELQHALQEMKNLNKDVNKTEEIFKDDFLTDYLTKKKWIDKTTNYLNNNNSDDEEDSVDDEEAELDRVDRFESKYNFRFEEIQAEEAATYETEDQESSNNSRFSSSLLPSSSSSSSSAYQVQGHRRQIDDSMRRVDDSRKLQRESRLERKAREKRQKQEELKRLKNLKKQEVSK